MAEDCTANPYDTPTGSVDSSGDSTPEALAVAEQPSRLRPSRSRKGRRQLCCPAHPEQRISGNGRKYFLHLLTAQQLRERGMSERRSRLVIQAYPVLVLSNEWLEELYCPACGTSRWCHVIKHSRTEHSVRWAPRELWEQVAHVDPLQPNPSVSEYSRRQARNRGRRADGRRLFEPG